MLSGLACTAYNQEAGFFSLQVLIVKVVLVSCSIRCGQPVRGEALPPQAKTSTCDSVRYVSLSAGQYRERSRNLLDSVQSWLHGNCGHACFSVRVDGPMPIWLFSYLNFYCY